MVQDEQWRIEARRRRARARRRRGLVRLAVLLACIGAGAYGVTLAVGALGGGATEATAASRVVVPGAKRLLPALPGELRGVHVTMALATLPGKIDQYLSLSRDGLNAIELDVKDE